MTAGSRARDRETERDLKPSAQTTGTPVLKFNEISSFPVRVRLRPVLLSADMIVRLFVRLVNWSTLETLN